MPAEDQQRLQSYLAYENVYWDRSETLQVLARGGDTDESVFVPNPRIIVETLNRYIGANPALDVDQATGTPASRLAAQQAFEALFARERFWSKYNSNKRFGLIRGDWVWHVLADPAKPQGSRLRILPVDPGSYFRIEDPEDPERLLGCHLVEQFVEGDDTFIKRQTYRRVQDANGNFTGTVTTETAIFKPDEWFDPTKGPQRVLAQPMPLPAQITALPVYHVPNFEEPQNPWGSSELRGFERILAAINGSYTDEDIALALEGLGVYYTETNRRPVDPDTGEVVDWNIYPGRVLQGTKLERVQGIGSVQPYTDHIDRMVRALREATAAGDAAIGNVDVQTAESGVALALRMAPTMAKATEKDRIILDVHNQMLWDLRGWLQAYEGINLADVTVRLRLGDKLPSNKRAEVELVALMMSTSPPLLSAGSARRYLEARGFAGAFADNEAALVAAEQQEITAWATADAGVVGREAGELTGADGIGAQTDQEGA